MTTRGPFFELIRAGVSRTSSKIGSIRACLARPKFRLGLPPSSTVTLGDKLPKNFLAASSAFSIEELIDSVMALAIAATNAASVSVGQRSTYAEMKFFRGNFLNAARTSDVFP